ncbi:MAG: hypothetical protein ACREO9_00180 [Lysobacterales bacterium]
MKYARKIALYLVTAFSVAAHAAPDGYSINSDSGSGNADSLYRIDLATGAHTLLGKVQSLGKTKIDVEGLAFAPDGTLYGVDDDSLTLFPINTDNGTVNSAKDVQITGMQAGGKNDFGLAFGCDGTLYTTSVTEKTLYRVSLDGTATRVGNLGSLNQNISALAAWGNPVKLYGLSNGLKGDPQVPDTRSLYSIDTVTGVTTLIGSGLGAGAASYAEAGMAFDSSGQLWAITDRRVVPEGIDFGSQVLKVNTTTGVATLASTTTETGFESLSVTVPGGCNTTGNGKKAEFVVQKRFVDGNDISPITLNLSCNTGLPLKQSIAVVPNDGVFGPDEVTFIVESFSDGALDCTVTEDPVAGYTTRYSCLGESACQAAQGATSCAFTGVTIGSENLCEVQNYPSPVQIMITKQWLFEAEAVAISDTAEIALECHNAREDNGEGGTNTLTWNWQIKGNTTLNASVYPDYAGSTFCRVTEKILASAVETVNDCANWSSISIGQGSKTCTLINTVFFEGIPVLNSYGKLLFALLLLVSGVIATRRW